MTRVPERFTPGSTVVREFVHRQRVWTAIPTRVIADTDRLALAHWPGTTVRVPASYTGALAGTRSRLDVVEDLAAGQWRMVSHVWSTLTMLTLMTSGEWFSVAAMFSGDDAAFAGWYVNFEEPFRRGTHEVRTNDLLLDLVVAPDGTPRWKDLDEYEHGRRVGFIDAWRHRHVQEARDRAIQMVAGGSGPFGEGWEHWRPDPDWPTPG